MIDRGGSAKELCCTALSISLWKDRSRRLWLRDVPQDAEEVLAATILGLCVCPRRLFGSEEAASESRAPFAA